MERVKEKKNMVWFGLWTNLVAQVFVVSSTEIRGRDLEESKEKTPQI